LQYGDLFRQLAGLALREPRLVPLLLGAAWRFRAIDWYRRAPFLPLPPAGYVAWRLHTAYGDDGAQPDSGELVRYLRWTARMSKHEQS
jgi:hypothetical protein